MLIHNADITGSLTINGVPYTTGSYTGIFIAGTNIMSANTVSLTGSFTGSFFGDGSQLSGVTSYTDADTLSFIQGYSGSYSGSFSGSFFGDGSNLSGVTSYTDADTLAFINSLDVVSGSIQTVSTVSDTFTSVTSYTVTHNFGTKEVIVSVYENDTLIFPSSINTPTVNTVTITFPEPVTGRAVVVKAGHIVSGSINYDSVLNKPTLVSGSSQISFTGITNKPTLVSGSSQITYSGLTGIPSGIVSGSTQVAQFGYATTGSNQFKASQTITGSLTVTGAIVAQTLNVQQVTSSVVFSSGSNRFGNNTGNTHQFTGSMSVTGSLAVAGAGTFTNSITAVNAVLGNTSNNTNAIQFLDANSTKTHLGSAFGATFIQNNNFYNGSAYVFDDNTIGSANITLSAGTINFQTGAANANPSTKLTMLTNGNVGIGTASPDSGLTIDATSTSFNALALRDTRAFNQSPEAALAFRTKFNSAGNFGTPVILVAYKDNATDGNQAGGLQIWTNGNSGPVERMRITSAGNIEIGTSSPSGTKALTIQAGTNGSASLRLKNDAHDWDVNCQTNDRFAIYSHTDSTERFVIMPTSGNVLIGTTDDVGAKLRINTSGTNDLLYLDSGANTDFAFKIITGANDVLTLRRQHSTLGNLDIMSFGFNGNVGIGTTLPDERLHITSPSGNVVSLVSTASGSFAQYQLKGGATTPWIIGTQDNYVGNALVFRNVSDRMAISTAGQVTFPFQPAWSVGLSSAQTISSPQIIAWNQSSGNDCFIQGGVTLNGDNGRVTVPVAGKYMIFASIRTEDPGAANGTNLNIRRNGTTILRHFVGGSVNSLGSFMYIETRPIIINCAANDYIDFNFDSVPSTFTLSAVTNTVVRFGGFLMG